jgi:hypothetical protein
MQHRIRKANRALNSGLTEGEQRNLLTLPTDLSASRTHPAVLFPVRRRRLLRSCNLGRSGLWVISTTWQQTPTENELQEVGLSAFRPYPLVHFHVGIRQLWKSHDSINLCSEPSNLLGSKYMLVFNSWRWAFVLSSPASQFNSLWGGRLNLSHDSESWLTVLRLT